MSYVGDFFIGATVRGTFNTRDTDGAPITLAGTPALRVTKDDSTTEDDSGITLNVDFDSRTGLHLWEVDTSADATYYSAGSDFFVYLTAGTVDSISVVGVCVGQFSLENRKIRWIRKATAAGGAAGSITLDASASATNDFYNNTLVQIVSGTGAGQSRIISDYVGATQVASVAANWVTTPDNTSVFIIYPSGTATVNANVTQVNSVTVDGTGTTLDPWGPA
jgi:hypothetical protein